MSDTPAREITASGSLTLALAAVGVHMAAMLVTTGAIATADVPRHHHASPLAERLHIFAMPGLLPLAVTGVLLMTLR